MNKNLGILANIVIGIIVVLVTFVVFFIGLSGDKDTFDYLSLSFILISEFALFISISIMMSSQKGSKGIIKVGIISILSIYWVVTVLVSILFKLIFESAIGPFITIHIVLMGIVGILCISIYMVSQNVGSSDSNTKNSARWLQDSENIVFSLKNNIELQEYKESLNELYETLKYSDKIPYDDNKDKEINLKVISLSEKIKDEDVSKDEIDNEINSIISLIKERNMLTKEAKRGGY